MKIILKKDRIKDIPKRWKEAYPEGKKNHKGEDVYETLFAEKELTQERAEEIIGNNSWGVLRCYACDKDSDLLLHLGEEADFNSHTFMICKKCFHDAVRFMRDPIHADRKIVEAECIDRGGHCFERTGVVYASFPPQYPEACKHCGKVRIAVPQEPYRYYEREI